MGYFYLKEITGTVSERAVRLGRTAETEEIKIIAAEMQMCANWAAVFIGCWDGVFLLERNHRNCFRKSCQTGRSSRNRKIKYTAAEMQMCASSAAVFIGCWDGVFLLEKEITGTVSERAVKLGGAVETEEIKYTAAEMQMCASSAAVFIGCWDGAFLLERNYRNCFRKSRQTGRSSRNRKIKNTAAEMQMRASSAAVF